MTILLQQKKHEINYIHKRIKKMFKLYKKTTKFLAIQGLNIEKSKIELKKSCYCLVVTKTNTLYQFNVLNINKVVPRSSDRGQKEFVIANVKRIVIMQDFAIKYDGFILSGNL